MRLRLKLGRVVEVNVSDREYEGMDERGDEGDGEHEGRDECEEETGWLAGWLGRLGEV